MKKPHDIVDFELNSAVQLNDPIEVERILTDKKPKKIHIRLLEEACAQSDLRCFSLLVAYATTEERFQVLNCAIPRNNCAAVETLTQFHMTSEHWNQALWKACSFQNQDMIDLLYPKADIKTVDDMFQELAYTPDEASYLIFLEHGLRQNLKATLAEETQAYGVGSSKSKI